MDDRAQRRNECPIVPAELFLSGFRLFRQAIMKRRTIAQLSKALTKAPRVDRTNAVTSVAREASALSYDAVIRASSALGIRSKRKPSGIMPLPMVFDSKGEPIDSVQALAERGRDHFSCQENGIPVTPQELLAVCDGRRQDARVHPRWEDLPTLVDIEMAFRRTKKGKAFFDDGVPGELLAKIPARMSSAFYPLFLKETGYQHEAAIYKGGRLVPMHKRGSPMLCENYRSLFVSSVVGKALHSHFRQKLGPIFEECRLPLQLGGVKGQGIQQASHVLRLNHDLAIRESSSYAVLFIDVQNAFYRLLREHIVAVVEVDRCLRELFASLQLPEDTFVEFQNLLQLGPAIDGAQVTAHLRSMFQEFY